MDAETRLYGVIGKPVSGSKSPWIHNTLFEATGTNGAYLAFEIQEDQLTAALNGFRAQGAVGLSVTIPYKEAVIDWLDAVDPYAAALGAVNAVHFENGRSIGYNTDGPGLIKVLKQHDTQLADRRVLVLGAGGASRGICGALLDAGVQVVGLWNRTHERAVELAETLKDFAGSTGRIQPEPDSASFHKYDVVINTTSVGMQPNVGDTPVEISVLKPGALVCDIVYKPHETRLIREARSSGHPVVYGVEMLIEQALLAQQIWNGYTEETLAPIRKKLLEQAIAMF